MNKSQRIFLNNNAAIADSHITVKLDQDVDTLEFLSMSLSTKDVYQDFNADYGVLIGRVLANGGIGIPNAKISIFIPLTDEDANNSEISSIYPYINPTDKNNEGKRYNLLPRVSQVNSFGISSPKQPFGSFPIKPELVTNLEFLNVYKKYYKYTALTNGSGDYMIFGVPIGTQTVHLSVDITDIGKFSMTPASMVTNLGYSPNLFTDNGSKIKLSTDLNDLPNIETQEISVDIVPFWGDTENFTIGITRQDFRIRSVLNNTFVLFGSSFTDGDNSMWGEESHSAVRVGELFRARNDANTTVGMYSKRNGRITEKIYYYPPTVTDAQINSGSVDPTTQMLVLDPSEYSTYKRDGDFVFIVSCNRAKIITDDFGNEVSVPFDSINGIFTEFRGFVTLEYTNDAIPMNFTGSIGADSKLVPLRYKLKFPQYAARNASFAKAENTNTNNWRKISFKFIGGKLYSFAKFHGLTYNEDYPDADQFFQDHSDNNGFFRKTTPNLPTNDPFWNVGIIVNGNYGNYINSNQQFPSNATNGSMGGVFGANWMNLSIYFPQIGFQSEGSWRSLRVYSADNFARQTEDNTDNSFFFFDNTQKIAASEFNTKWFARSDLNWTDIIEIPKQDILAMNNVTKKGFTELDPATPLGNTYRNKTKIPTGWAAACPITAGVGSNTYFYKGINKANCIEFVVSLGLV
ncbi:MAG: hypothetical protein WC428_00795 [Candidatus Paceibacterota bacterium]